MMRLYRMVAVLMLKQEDSPDEAHGKKREKMVSFKEDDLTKRRILLIML